MQMATPFLPDARAVISVYPREERRARLLLPFSEMAAKSVTPSPSRSNRKPRSKAGPAEEAILEYAGDEADELPIGGYATMMGVFLGSFVGLVAVARATGALPERLPVRDVALL